MTVDDCRQRAGKWQAKKQYIQSLGPDPAKIQRTWKCLSFKPKSHYSHIMAVFGALHIALGSGIVHVSSKT